MSSESDKRPVNLEALTNLNPAEPVVMINLLNFNSTGGVDSYQRYTREVQPHLDRVGATVRYAGTSPITIIGDEDRPWWDAILVVEYPTPQAFIDMVSDPAYQDVHRHRAAALSRGDLVATSGWMVS